jgi:predicted nucleotide-binding protein (sugar kinase/HSP70/actin superfamily)
MCEVHKVEIEGEEPLYYGSRCEKYNVREKTDQKFPDFAVLRQRCLLKRYIDTAPSQINRGTIGIPRVLHFFDYYPFWKAFFETLGYKIVNSDLSNHEIVETSLEQCSAETCFPVKMAFGHVANLIKKDVNYIFLPGIIEYTDLEKAEGNYICPYVQTISNTVRTKFDSKKLGVKFIGAPIKMLRDNTRMLSQLRPILKILKASDRNIRRAVGNGFKAYDLFRNEMSDIGRKVLDELEPDEKCLVIISRPYNGYDRRLSLEIPAKIRKMGFKAIPMDFIPLDIASESLSTMYWLFGRKILSAADYIRKHPNLYAVYLTSFGCGPDSFITHFFRRRMSGKPSLQLELDEHSADAGIITRIEAFLDSLRFYRYQPPITEYRPGGNGFDANGRTIYIPYMCDHAFAVRAAFERCGLKAEVMEEPDELSLEYGKKFTSGKECFPCLVTTGDIIKKLHEKDFDPKRTVFFMPGADGPCRFGQYSQYHRVVLDELGYKDVPIYSPNSRTSYADFRIDTSAFRRLGWQGIILIDCLVKALLKTRPYEIEPNSTEHLYYKYVKRVDEYIVNDGDILELAAEAGREFRKLPRSADVRPTVGLVGEIYLRNNRFSNNHLITKLESMGVEVKLASFAEWINYTSLIYKLDTRDNHDWKGYLKAFLQIYFQHKSEHGIEKIFSKYYPIDFESRVDDVVTHAAPYLPVSIKGEAVLSIGKAIDFINRGASGIVNCMPFNCMPGTIVSSLSRKISKDLNNIPWLNMSYEGLQDTGEETRLEAFVDQVKNSRLISIG